MKTLTTYTTVTILAVLLAVSSTHAQSIFFGGGITGNGKVIQKTVSLTDFSAINVSSSIDIYLEPSGSNEAIIVTDENIMSAVSILVKDKTLVLKTTENIRKSTKGIKVYVPYKTLESIKASGSSDVYMKDDAVLKAPVLAIEGSGASDFRLALEVKKLNCIISGSSDAYLTGKAESVNVINSGASDFKCKDLQTVNCTIKASGSSDAIVTVSESISASASGASDIYFYGNPAKRSLSATGASDIKNR